MTPFRRWFIFSLFLGIGISFAWADFSKNDQGTAGLAFLKIPPSARELAMGGAGGPVAEGAASLYWNPSQIGALPGVEALVSGSLQPVNTRQNFAAVAWPFHRDLGAGFSVQHFDSGEIEQIDSIGQSVGTFSPRDLALAAGFSTSAAAIRMGLTAKLIHSKIIHSDTVYSADAGLSLETSDQRTRGSLVVKNIAEKIKYIDKNTDIQSVISIGVRHQWSSALLTVEQNFPRDGAPATAIGVETRIANSGGVGMDLRGGFNQGQARDKEGLAGFSFGLGLQLANLQLDYAWTPLGELDQSHTLSLGITWFRPNDASATTETLPPTQTEN